MHLSIWKQQKAKTDCIQILLCKIEMISIVRMSSREPNKRDRESHFAVIDKDGLRVAHTNTT